MDIKIYINYFSDSCVIKNNILTPLHVGRAVSGFALNMQGDDEGDNISVKNPMYCELTGLYWVWKNNKQSDYIGMLHYRRFLDFCIGRSRENVGFDGLDEQAFSPCFLDEYGLCEKQIESIVTMYDMILPEPFNVSKVSQSSLKNHYCTALNHHERDFNTARQAIADLYPEDLKYFDQMSHACELYACNMFVFKRDVFEEYCAWLFPLLEKIESDICFDGYSATEKRVIGYLGERLLTLFVIKKKAENPNLSILHLKKILVLDVSPMPKVPPLPETPLPVTTLALSTDEDYLPHAATLILSALVNANQERFIDVIVLHDTLSSYEKKQLMTLEKHHPHCKINLINMSNKYKRIELNSYFHTPTLYRLAIGDILSNRKKALFLDSDMVVLGDICRLFEIDLEDNTVAAVPDLIMKAFIGKNVVSHEKSGSIPVKKYLQEYVGLGKNYLAYFQAGMIVFDLEKLRAANSGRMMLQEIAQKNYWFLDQDVLNKHLQGKVKYVDYTWNVSSMDLEHLSFLSTEDVKNYHDSHDHVRIIHFAGIMKPWINTLSPFRNYYWYYLRQTFWYETVLFKYEALFLNKIEKKQESTLKIILRKIWRMIPFSIRKPLGPFLIKLCEKIR